MGLQKLEPKTVLALLLTPWFAPRSKELTVDYEAGTDDVEHHARRELTREDPWWLCMARALLGCLTLRTLQRVVNRHEVWASQPPGE
jgi:hypothetical protein